MGYGVELQNSYPPGVKLKIFILEGGMRPVAI